VTRAEIHWPLATQYGQSCLPQWSVYESWPVSITSTGSVAFKHFNPPVYTSLWQTFLSILGSLSSVDFLPFYPLTPQISAKIPSYYSFWCKPLEEQPSLCHAHWTTTEPQHTVVWPWATAYYRVTLSHSIPPSDLEPQYDQTSAVLPAMKYSKIPDFFSLQYIKPWCH
jgi:hypothetical protein